MSDNKLVEGFETSVTLDEPEEVHFNFCMPFLRGAFNHVLFHLI